MTNIIMTVRNKYVGTVEAPTSIIRTLDYPNSEADENY